MDDEQRTLESQEEQKAEKDMVDESEDTIREKLAEEFGLDPDEDGELFGKIVNREKESRKRLSKAIEQKRKYREQLFSTDKKETKSRTSNKETPDIEEIATRKAMEILEQRDLKDLGLSEDLEEELLRVSKIEGISVREAAKNPYFVFKKQEHEKAERIRNATPTRKGGSKYIIDPDKDLDPSDFDMSTEEGRKAWDEAKALKKKSRQ